MKNRVKILVIEDEPSVRLGLTSALRQAGHTAESAGGLADGMDLFSRVRHDIVISDLVMPGGGGMEVLDKIRRTSPETGVIIMTAFGTVKTAVEAMRLGAFDYISKPFVPEELMIVIEKFISRRKIEEENLALRDELRRNRESRNVLGESPEIKRLRETVRTVAGADGSVIIYGETGTGKELVADALFALGARNERPFIKINCAAIPETLFEAELFGYEKGAFTGALQRKKGKLEAAEGGTVLFDEIGDMPLPVQAKLLRVIEEKKVCRVGSNESVDIDARFLYATARDLKEAVKAGAFRDDLYYRINVLPLHIPPLRERKEDIPLLAAHFLESFSGKYGKTGMVFSESVAALLMEYDYPGNVRQLKHAIEMAVTVCTEPSIKVCHLPPELREFEGADENHAAKNALSLAERVRIFEKDLISSALEETGWKKAAAAEKLGICRRTLWKKMHDLQFPDALLEKDD